MKSILVGLPNTSQSLVHFQLGLGFSICYILQLYFSLMLEIKKTCSYKGTSPNYFFQNNFIVTLSWNPIPPPNNVIPLISRKITCPSEITIAFDLPLPLSAIIPLDELLILSCWMIVNCTYILLKHSAKQCRLYIPTFLLVSSPDPTYERGGLVTSGQFLRLH